MRRAQVFLACLVCRGLKALLRLLGRGGTALPGKAALKVCPDLLARLAGQVDTVMVTGTNGKTTTSGMLRHILRETGVPCFSNRTGANLMSGITAEFVANASLTGRPRKKLAVIECDEGIFAQAARAIRPRAVAVTNLFRDQLDRYGEVTYTRNSILTGLAAAPDAVLCLNADCSLTATLALEVPNRVLFYGVDVPGPEADGAAPSDAPYCLHCRTKYVYTRRTYAHLGDWSCPSCGRKRPEPAFCAVAALPAEEGGTMVTLRTPEGELPFRLALPALYNVYNALAALTVCSAMGWDVAECARTLSSFGAVFGRMESLRVGNTPVEIVLVKNPAGCDRALEYLAGVPGDCLPVFCLNDNIADGTDVSWIWDAGYERLLQARDFARVCVYGTRAQDMRVRLKYAGLDDGRIAVLDTADALAETVRASSLPVYVLPNYTSMLEVRDKLAGLGGRGRFWE